MEQDIICAIYGSPRAAAHALGVSPITVRAWRRRGVPARYALKIAAHAAAFGAPVGLRDVLEAIHNDTYLDCARG